MKADIKFLAVLVLINLFDGMSGHGYLWNPVNRGSRWRTNSSAPHNYNDNGMWCGGYGVQWSSRNGGKCGLCGDNYGDATPRSHELGGKFGEGVITKSYKAGSVIKVTVRLTANHKGFYYFRICNLDVERESDACFERYKIQTTTGGDTYPLNSTAAKDYVVSLQLPSSLTCNHCVLQWTYAFSNGIEA